MRFPAEQPRCCIDRCLPGDLLGAIQALSQLSYSPAVDAAPWLVGREPDEAVPADELFEKLQPFKERVADDIRTGEDEA